jgi:chromo domain-containing protein 1
MLRAKKRQKSELPGEKGRNAKSARPLIVESGSDSDSPLMDRVRARQGARSTRETRPPRRQILQPTWSSASSSNDSEDSIDSLMEQLKTKDSESERRKPRQKPRELTGRPQRAKDQSGSLKRIEKRSSHATGSSSKSAPEKSNDLEGSRASTIGSSRPHISSNQPPKQGSGQHANAPAASTSRRNSKVAENTNVDALRPSTANEVERPKQSMRRSAPTIKMVNEPKTGPLKAAWHKGGAQDIYNKVRFRRKAELRGRYEGTPDPSVLSFVNAPPGLTPRMLDQANSNPYVHRDTVALRPVQPNDSDDEAAAPSTTKVPDWEKEKVPMTCFDWRNGSCRYSAERCWFLHRDTARIGPANGYVPKSRRYILWAFSSNSTNYCVVLFRPNTGDQSSLVLIG